MENELTRKMRDEIKKSEKIMLKALKSLSDNALRNDHNSPIADITSDGEKTISVQRACRRLDSEEENKDANESFFAASTAI